MQNNFGNKKLKSFSSEPISATSSTQPGSVSLSPENDSLLNTRYCTTDGTFSQQWQPENSEMHIKGQNSLQSVRNHSGLYPTPQTAVSAEGNYGAPANCFGFYSNSILVARHIGLLNAIILQRLQKIANNTNGDRELELITYRQWLGILLKLTDFFIKKIYELKSEMAERVKSLQRDSTGRRKSQSDGLVKCHRDMHSLTEVIRNAFHYGVRDFRGFLQTISLSKAFVARQAITVQEHPVHVALEGKEKVDKRKKVHENLKALSVKLNEKHDEIQVLRKHLASMEDEMRYARKNLRLKKEMIETLRKGL